MATHNPDLGRSLELSCTQRREGEQASLGISNRNSNNINIISDISNSNHINIISDISHTNHSYGERNAGQQDDAGIPTLRSNSNNIDSNNNSNSIIDSNNNSNISRVSIDSNNSSNVGSIKDGSDSSVSDDGNSPTVQHVIGADPWRVGGNGQTLCGGNNDEHASSASHSRIGGEGVDGGGEEENSTGGVDRECASADTSYEEGDSLLGLNEHSGGIDMGAEFNFGRGMDIVIGEKNDGVSDELVATVGSMVALLSGAQAAVKENIASMQRQGLCLVEAKAAIRALAGRLSISEEEKEMLVFAKDELSATLAVLEEEKEDARTSNGDASSEIRELTLRAEQCEAAKACLGSENAALRATVSEEQRKNRALYAKVTLLKATLAMRNGAEAVKIEEGSKATPASTSSAATYQTHVTAAAAETPRGVTRRPLAAVDSNSERKSGNGGKSPPSLAPQAASKDYQGKCTPVAKLPVPPSLASLRLKAEASPSIVSSPLSTASFERDCSIAPAPLKVDSPEGNKVSSPRDYRNDSISSKVESPVQQTAPAPRRSSARIAAKAGEDTAPPPRRSSARIAAKAGGDTAPPPRRSSARIAAKTSQDSIATSRGGVATRRSKRVEGQSPLSPLRVTRSTFRAAEEAALAADKRLTSEPRVKDRKRFMRF